MSDVLIIDSGADTIKIGLGSESVPQKFFNCVYKPRNSSRLLVSNEIESYRDKSSLYYLNPKKNGYTINWDVQRTIYEHIFYDNLNLNCSELTALVTEPELDPLSNQRTIDEVFFEDYGFKAIYRTNNSNIVSDRYSAMSKTEGCVIVESGHSFTHIVPYWKGKKLKQGLIRLDIGGKLLTNYLKELISYRQLNLMDEFLVCQKMKEQSCYCSTDFKSDMKKLETIKKLYVLPNFTLGTGGRTQPPTDPIEDFAQTLVLRSEQFQVPELLFNPSDAQINQCGLHEAVHEAILRCNPEQQPILYRNIMAMGGNIGFHNFRARLLDGVRGLANDEYDVRVGDPKNPSDYAWVCASKWARSPNFSNVCVTKQQWMEEGNRATENRFTQI